MLQMNSLRKNEYQAIKGQGSELSGRPDMVGCLANSGRLSWSDFGRFDTHAVANSESLSDSLISEPNRLNRTKYALYPPLGNRKMEV